MSDERSSIACILQCALSCKATVSRGISTQHILSPPSLLILLSADLSHLFLHHNRAMNLQENYQTNFYLLYKQYIWQHDLRPHSLFRCLHAILHGRYTKELPTVPLPFHQLQLPTWSVISMEQLLEVSFPFFSHFSCHQIA